MRKVQEVADDVGAFIEPDAVGWAAALSTDFTDQDAVRVVVMLSMAVSLKRIADAQVLVASRTAVAP